MPHASADFPFEWHILEWAAGFSVRRSGQRWLPFLLVLDESGYERQLHLGAGPARHDSSAWGQCRAREPSWFFYDPFEAPEYTFVAWQSIARPHMEALIGRPFSDADFAGRERRYEWPESWSVMF